MNSRSDKIAFASVVVISGVVAASSSVTAAPVAIGDLFVSGIDVGQFTANPNNHVRQYTVGPTGVIQPPADVLVNGGAPLPFSMAFDGAGNLHLVNGSDLAVAGGSVTRFAGPNLTAATTLFGSSLANRLPQSASFDAAGNIYVGTRSSQIYRFNAAGVETGQFNVAVPLANSNFIDLANDQSTLFYTSGERSIKRWNVGVAPGELASLPVVLPADGQAFDIRLLPDGGVLLADGTSIRKINADLSTIEWSVDPDPDDVNTYFSLALDDDGVSFWVLDVTDVSVIGNPNVFHLSLNGDPTPLATLSTGNDFILAGGIAVAGEVREALRISEPERMGPALFGIGLVALGAMNRRRKQSA